MEKLLITGGSGMVGRNLIEKNPGYEILIPSHSELDLLNQNAISNYIDLKKPDIVIHAAGLVGGIQANIKNPVGFFLSNLMMGINLVSACYSSGIKRILNLGSSCIYPSTGKNPLSENMIHDCTPESTNEGYAYAKRMVIKICQYYNSQKGTNYKTIIPCNLYGKYDKFDIEHSHMIAGAIDKLHKWNGKIWGKGTARREFMFAGDLAEIIWKYISRFDEMPDIMNIGTGKDYTINQYYLAIAGVVGFRGRFVHDTTKPTGSMRKLLDVTIQRKFNLMPKTTLKKGLKKTYEYYINNIDMGQRRTSGNK